MDNQTVTYSMSRQGWTSFWSFIPDWMMGMNSSLYTWKNGDLYRHNVNPSRNNFYGINYPSKITTIFNKDPLSNKMFKTINLDSTSAWDIDLFTDMSEGFIDIDFFKEKEGMFYSYIRRNDETIDKKSLSTQGVGTLLSYNPTTQQLNFSFNIGSSISNLDKIYKLSNGVLILIGTVSSHSDQSIVLASPVINTPVAGDMILYVKNSQGESYGARGYFMEVEMTHPYIGSIPNGIVIDEVELFAITTSSFKSYP